MRFSRLASLVPVLTGSRQHRRLSVIASVIICCAAVVFLQRCAELGPRHTNLRQLCQAGVHVKLTISSIPHQICTQSCSWVHVSTVIAVAQGHSPR
jgi:hypothetical protein